MKKLALSIASLVLVSGQAFAGTHIDNRGYQACERQLTKDFSDAGVMFERQYMVKRSDENRTFFINKTVWSDAGVRTPVNTTCVTSSNGRDVLDVQSDFGPHVILEDVLAAR